jgi:uncharacterized membrane protein
MGRSDVVCVDIQQTVVHEYFGFHESVLGTLCFFLITVISSIIEILHFIPIYALRTRNCSLHSTLDSPIAYLHTSWNKQHLRTVVAQV